MVGPLARLRLRDSARSHENDPALAVDRIERGGLRQRDRELPLCERPDVVVALYLEGIDLQDIEEVHSGQRDLARAVCGNLELRRERPAVACALRPEALSGDIQTYLELAVEKLLRHRPFDVLLGREDVGFHRAIFEMHGLLACMADYADRLAAARPRVIMERDDDGELLRHVVVYAAFEPQ